MIAFSTPEKAGFSQATIDTFLQELQRRELNLHAILMLKGNEIFFEKYWAPFTAETPHRMYSVTKSFVSIAIGCLLDEGKLQLDDPIVQYFPDKLPEQVSPYLQMQTIRHMLMMNTCFKGVNWFYPGVVDRTKHYFSSPANHYPGTLFDYDSTDSYILGALVERLSGMSLLDYLKVKVLNTLGGFENAQILQVPDGVAWGDSAMLCTPRALMNFARFVMNLGVWDGKRLLSEQYLRQAISPLGTNDLECRAKYDRFGYGYQIWGTEQDGFAFHGMGGQFAICIPKKDFIFVCTGDNQYNDHARQTLFRAVFDILIPDEKEPVPDTGMLPIAHGRVHSDFAARVHQKTFICDPNPMGIKWFRLEFGENEGKFIYQNAQGEKTLPFGLGRNWFGKFPQLGYSDDRGNVHEITDFMYDCASSAGWIEEQKLQLRVQIIDRYFGSMVATFGFLNDNAVTVRMIRHAEDFLQEYDGWMAARSGDISC